MTQPPSATPRGATAGTGAAQQPSSGSAAGGSGGEAPPDAATRNSLIVASTFANLELVSVKKTLDQYQKLYEEAQKANRELVASLQDRDRDAVQVVEFLRVEVEAKASQVLRLEADLSAIDGKKTAEAKKQAESYESTIRQRDDTIAGLRDHVAKLTRELDDLAEFRRQQLELTNQLRAAREEKQKVVAEYERELSRVKFGALEEKVKLRAVEQAMGEAFESEVHAKAMELIDAKSKQIHADNQTLIKDKQVLDKEVQRLTQLGRETQDALTLARREAELSKTSQLEFAKQGCTLSRNARENAKKAAESEQRMAAMTKEFNDAMLSIQGECERRVVEAERRTEEALQCVAVHRKELVTTRGMATAVAAQRTELERFFYDALDYVVGQRRMETAARLRTLAANPGSGGGQQQRVLFETEAAMLRAMQSRADMGYRGDLDARRGASSTPRGQPRQAAADFRLGTPLSARTAENGTGYRPHRPPFEVGGVGAPIAAGASTAFHQRAFRLTEVGTASDGTTGAAAGSTEGHRHQLSSRGGGAPSTSTALVVAAPSAGQGYGPGTGAPVAAVVLSPVAASSHHHRGIGETTGGARQVVDFATLTWEDKEKVIRALLLELNRQFDSTVGSAKERLMSVEHRNGGGGDDLNNAAGHAATHSQPPPSTSSVSRPLWQRGMETLDEPDVDSEAHAAMVAAAFPSAAPRPPRFGSEKSGGSGTPSSATPRDGSARSSLPGSRPATSGAPAAFATPLAKIPVDDAIASDGGATAASSVPLPPASTAPHGLPRVPSALKKTTPVSAPLAAPTQQPGSTPGSKPPSAKGSKRVLIDPALVVAGSSAVTAAGSRGDDQGGPAPDPSVE